ERYGLGPRPPLRLIGPRTPLQHRVRVVRLEAEGDRRDVPAVGAVRIRRIYRGLDRQVRNLELLDPDVAELDVLTGCLTGRMVLQADVTLERTAAVAGVGRDLDSVEGHPVVLADRLDLHRVPLADGVRGERLGRGEGVDRAG